MDPTSLRDLKGSDNSPGPDLDASERARLSEYIAILSQQRSSAWAWAHYCDTVQDLIRLLGARRLMEIGGGRTPLFGSEKIASLNLRYVVNDISEAELALAPAHVEKSCFDIADRNPILHESLSGQIDLMFSKMVFEHVPDVHQAYKNIYHLLAPGGVCLNFHPVLYSLPFLINFIMPEFISAKLLRTFFPYRNPDQTPKYPARYDHCRIAARERDALLSIGFRKVWQMPFWHHDYFRIIPGLYHLDLAVARLAERADWTALASYCYTIVVK